MDISGQVIGVTGEHKNTKFGPKTVFRVAFSDGQTYDTWKADIATKAQQLQGQQVDIRTEVKTNAGNDGTVYTNYGLLDIAPSGQLVSAALAVPLLPSVAPGNGAVPAIPIVASQGGMSPERESKIVKQSCLATAFNFAAHLYEGDSPDWESAVSDALNLAKTLYAEVYGQQNIAQTPTAVAELVNQSIPEAVSVGVDTPAW